MGALATIGLRSWCCGDATGRDGGGDGGQRAALNAVLEGNER
jgi:hypothetical protein